MLAPAYDLARALYSSHHPRLLLVREDTPPSYGAAEQTEDWKHVDARVCELGLERAAHEREVCRWLVEAERLGVPGRLGMASLREYAAWRLGLNGRQAEERLRVGKALLELPLLDDALSKGQLWWTAVRELTRVALPSTEEAWLSWARGKGVRQVEKQVATRRVGELPSDPADQSRIKHRLSFQVRAETMAMFRELQASIRDELGDDGDVDDDLLLHEVVRRAMGGSDDGGRAPYQVAVTRCDRCQEVAVDAAGESFTVDETVKRMVRCDAQHVGEVGLVDEVGTVGEVGEARVRPHDGPHVRAGAKRATQTVPPATRRGVLRRGRARCSVPGCRNHRHLHVHHLKPRSEGGDHDPKLLLPLCHRHHTAVHDGTLVIAGDGARGFTFAHADGATYGSRTDTAEVALAKQAFDALRGLGFKMTQAQQLIADVQRDGPPATLEAFLRSALRRSG